MMLITQHHLNEVLILLVICSAACLAINVRTRGLMQCLSVDGPTHWWTLLPVSSRMEGVIDE